MSSAYQKLNELLGSSGEILPADGSAVLAPGELAAAPGASGGIAHDGSNMFGKLALWRPPYRSADADVLPEKVAVDARTRDMLRNDAFVASGSEIWKDSIVGARYMLSAQPATKILFGKDDDTWEKEFQEEVETRFGLWAESQKCWADSTGHNTFTELVRLAVGVHVAGGEVVGLSRWMPAAGRPYRTAFQFIDADRLSTPDMIDPYLTSRMRNGVEVDADGRPIAYYFRNSHENEGPFQAWEIQQQNWTRIPANRPWGRDNVLHLFDQFRPDQHRGISALVSALREMRMLRNFRQTQLEKNIIAASYAAAFEAELPTDVTTALGAGYSADGNATTQYMMDYLAAVNSYSGGSKNLHINGASIPILPPGVKLNLQNPGTSGPEQAAYESSLLRYIAAAAGLSYEQFSRDYTNTNYSSARAAIGDVWKTLQSRKRRVADRVANFIYRAWLEEAINRNEIESLKRRNVPNFYEGMNAEAYCMADWIGAGRGMIDPLKETQADILALKGGLTTKEEVISRRSGGDWRRVAKQIARERAVDAEFENPSIYDQDSTDQTNALSGSPQERQQ